MDWQIPAMGLRGGETNVIFTYFDIRKYFDLSNSIQYVSVSKSELLQSFNSLKIQSDLHQKEIILQELYEKVSVSFQFLGFQIYFFAFKEILNYIDRSFFSLAKDPREDDSNCRLNSLSESYFQSLWIEFYDKPADSIIKTYVSTHRIREFLKTNLYHISWVLFRKQCLMFFEWEKIYQEYSENVNKGEHQRKIKLELKRNLNN